MIDLTALPVRPLSLADLQELIGHDIGPTPWYDVTQERVNAFAEVTQDRQWIHVDVDRAARSPMGGTIAHGLYSLSLGPGFLYQLLSFDGFSQGLNYGYDKVRFPAVLPVGSQLRMTLRVLAAEPLPGGVQLRTRQTFERADSPRPVAVAEALARLVEHES